MKYKGKCVAAAVMAGAFMTCGRYIFETTVHYKDDENALKRKKIKIKHMKVNHPRYQFERIYEDGKAWCQSQKMEDWYIQSNDGLRLHAYYFPTENAERYVLLCHGYKGNGFSEFANIAKFLHENNCNLLFVDQRCCGMSEGEYITFGVKEKYDIKKWTCLISKKNKDRLPIYLYGESMGAASVIMSSGLGLPSEVKGIISDCGFHSIKGQIRDMAGKWFHIPRVELVLHRLSTRCKFLAGFNMNEADTSKALAANKIPILFFHGSEDTYVYPKNSIENYKLCKAPKQLVIIYGARHLCSCYANPELYREKVMNFFFKYDLHPNRQY